MDQSTIPETIDWGDVPWFGSERTFTTTELEEIRIYQKQGAFISAAKRRRAIFDQRLQDMTREFEMAETQFHENITNPFALKIWEDSIQKTRRESIPPYAFDRFLHLPKEIQLHIWFMAIEPPRTQRNHMLLSMTLEYADRGQRRRENQNPRNSSTVLCPPSWSRADDTELNVLTKVCLDARATYRSAYARLASREGSSHAAVSYHSYNTSNDNFYISSRHDWSDYKVLVDLVILQNTTRPLSKQVATDLSGLRSIRNLTVDLNIFGRAPVSIWAQFPRLEVLTIAFYPFKVIKDHDFSIIEDEDFEARHNGEDFDLHMSFKKPRRNKKFVARAEAIFKLAMDSLQVVSREKPSWKLPRPEVKKRRTGDEKLDWLAEHSDDEDDDILAGTEPDSALTQFDQLNQVQDAESSNSQLVEGAEDSENEAEVDDDDSLYLAQLSALFSSTSISKEQIKRLKQRFHPSHSHPTLQPRYFEEEDLHPNYQNRRRYSIDSEGRMYDDRPFGPDDDEYW